MSSKTNGDTSVSMYKIISAPWSTAYANTGRCRADHQWTRLSRTPLLEARSERRYELTSPQQLVPTRGIGCRYYKTTPSGAVCKVRRYKRPGILGGTQESRFLAGSKLPTPRRDPNNKKSSNICVKGTHLLKFKNKQKKKKSRNKNV